MPEILKDLPGLILLKRRPKGDQITSKTKIDLQGLKIRKVFLILENYEYPSNNFSIVNSLRVLMDNRNAGDTDMVMTYRA